MAEASRSPNRGTFQRDNYIAQSLNEGKSLEDPQVATMIEWYDSWGMIDEDRQNDPEWRKNNLEWDLRTTDWILEKVRSSTVYAQNLYAALCNNDFAKDNDVIKVLKKEWWHCSWRYAGGIIADMQQQGDYIDWYCSGIRNKDTPDDILTTTVDGYVYEGVVTDEIKADLERLGWIVIFNEE